MRDNLSAMEQRSFGVTDIVHSKTTRSIVAIFGSIVHVPDFSVAEDRSIRSSESSHMSE